MQCIFDISEFSFWRPGPEVHSDRKGLSSLAIDKDNFPPT